LEETARVDAFACWFLVYEGIAPHPRFTEGDRAGGGKKWN